MDNIIKYSSFFAITPWYSLQHRKVVHKKIFKCYSIILAVFVFNLSLFLLYQRFNFVYSAEKRTLDLVDFLTEFVSVSMFLVTALGAAFWNMPTWEEFIKTYGRMKNFGAQNIAVKYSHVTFLLGNVFLIALVACDFLTNAKNITILLYFNTVHIFLYYEFVLMTLNLNITIFLKYGYRQVRDLISTADDGSRNSNSIIENLKESKMCFIMFNELGGKINKLLGWPLLLNIFKNGLNILKFLLFIVKVLSDGSEHGDQVTIFIFYILTSLTWLIAIIFSCDSIVREADELLMNCYKLEQKLPLLSKEMEEIESLKQLIISKSPKLTAAGFFEIRRSTLLSLLGTTTTYFIVAMQFNSL